MTTTYKGIAITTKDGIHTVLGNQFTSIMEAMTFVDKIPA